MKYNPKLIERFGSEEAVRQHYQDMQRKSRRTYKGTGGFRALKQNNPEKLKQIITMGVKARRVKKQQESESQSQEAN